VRTVANQTVTANNGTTHYVWDISGQIIAEVNGTTGVTQREMIYLDSMPLAAIDAVASPKKTYAVHVDHLNRPVMLTDAAKVNVWWASYEPFGKVRATGGALTQNLGLPGQWFQLESGLAHNWHRHYDPTTGRYTTADPLGFVDGPSVFAYAGNGPHRMVDPSGLDNPSMGPYGGCWWGVCVQPAGPLIGSGGYGKFRFHPKAKGRLGGFGANKCNIFTSDMQDAMGLPSAMVPGNRIPLANEWGNPNSKIPNYEVLPRGALPGIGDIVAIPGDPSGHVGMFSPLEKSGDNGTVSQSSNTGTVVNNRWGFDSGQTPVIWRSK
jgi:RHS repeat-associated protein